MRLGLPDPTTWASRPTGSPPRPTRTTRSPRAIWRDEIGLPPERMAALGRRRQRRRQATSGGWPRPGPAGRAARSTSIAARTSPKGPSACPTTPRPARAGSRSGTSCSWSSTSGPTAASPLPFTSVDTGMGLERLASVLQQVPTNYDTDLFTPIHARMRELLGHDPEAFEAERFSYQVIADHSRAVTFLIGDDVLPSNEGRGYVLRRILRRAVRHGRLLGRRSRSWPRRPSVVIDVMGEAYPHLVERRDEILGGHRARGGAVRADARRRHEAARGGARRRSPTTDRVVGRRAEDLPARCAAAPRRRRVPAPRHVRLPDRPDRRAGGRVRRRRRPRRASRRRSPSSATAAARARRPSSSKHAELAALYGAIQARAGDTDVPRLRDDDRRRAAWSRSCATASEFDELTGHGDAPRSSSTGRPFYAEGGGQVGDHGVLREPGGGSDARSTVDGHAEAARRARSSIAARSTAGCAVGETVDGRGRRRAARRTRCATTPARTCSTGRCATWSGSAPARPARS